MPSCLLVITAPIDLEPKLLDLIIGTAGSTGQVRAEVALRQDGDAGLSAAEQVLGQRRSLELRMAVDDSIVAALLAELRRQFPGKGIRFHVLPILHEGAIE